MKCFVAVLYIILSLIELLLKSDFQEVSFAFFQEDIILISRPGDDIVGRSASDSVD